MCVYATEKLCVAVVVRIDVTTNRGSVGVGPLEPAEIPFTGNANL
jgi:hypothetical protein